MNLFPGRYQAAAAFKAIGDRFNLITNIITSASTNNTLI